MTSHKVSQTIETADSFILNECSALEREHLFEAVAQPFLTSQALPVEAFEANSDLQRMFYEVSSFDFQGNEYVAMVEGKRAPIFGFLYSPQKSQLTTEALTHMPLDQSMKARYHAQYLANYVVDSARESPNKFDSFE